MQFDFNVYYGTTDSGETNKIDNPLVTRTAGATYVLNQIIRTVATPSSCVNGTESACFLYQVTTPGTTSGSPTYCTTLGCVQKDGSAVLKAIRGPYIFKRKLRTVSAGEPYVIPYARVLPSLLEATYCPSSGSDATGSREGIGINADLYPNGIFASSLITPPVVASVSLTPNLPSPKTVGALIIFTAQATGGSGNYEYRFTLNGPATNNTPQVVQKLQCHQQLDLDNNGCRRWIKHHYGRRPQPRFEQ